MVNEEYWPEQLEIFEEEESKVKPWIRTVALLLVFCIFSQGVIFACGPDLESTVNLKLQKPAAAASRPLLLSALRALKTLFITEAYAETGEAQTKSKPAAASQSPAAGENKSYNTANTSTVRPTTGGKVTYTSMAGRSYEYKTQTNPSCGTTYTSGSWVKANTAGSSVAAQPGAGQITQPAAGPAYYFDVRPALSKPSAKVAEVTLVRTSISKDSNAITSVAKSAGTKFVSEDPVVKSEPVAAKLEEQNITQTVMISKGSLASAAVRKAETRIASKVDLDLDLADSSKVEITRASISRHSQEKSIDFSKSPSTGKFYQPPALPAINVFKSGQHNINKRIGFPEKVFVSLPNTFAHNPLKEYAAISRDNLAAAQKKQDSESRNSASSNRQPLSLPSVPVNIPLPAATDSGPGPSPTPPTPSTGTNSTSSASSPSSTSNTGSIQQPYGPPPANIPLPGFSIAGSYEIVLSHLAELHGEALASARGDGGVTVPSSGIMPSPEAGRNREGNILTTTSYFIPAEQLLLRAGEVLTSVLCKDFDNSALKIEGTHPETDVLFTFGAPSNDNYNIGNINISPLKAQGTAASLSEVDSQSASKPVLFCSVSNQNSQPAGVEPFRRAPQLNQPAVVHSGNPAPVSIFLAEKSDTGALPQLLAGTQGVFLQGYTGILK
jgi:hypothetical protein